ncbi:MAG: Lrp/AsnC family transcriptional regulator [Alphaproteobacteria bacterium]
MSGIDKKLLDGFQRDFPLTARPFAEIAEKLGCGEDDVIEALRGLAESGTLSRVGAVIRTGTVGTSTLAAMSVPPERLAEVAELVSGFDAVNHNYEREHRLNLWFVVTGPDKDAVDSTLAEIKRLTAINVLNQPMLQDYHLDLGFKLQWT